MFLGEKKLDFGTNEFGYYSVNGVDIVHFTVDGVLEGRAADKLYKALGSAEMVGMPVVYTVDCNGINLNDSAEMFTACSALANRLSAIKYSVPCIAVVKGRCLGLAAMLAAKADFIVAVDGNYPMLDSVDTYTYDVNPSDFAERFPTVECTADELNATLGKLLSFVPSNSMDDHLDIETQYVPVANAPFIETLLDGNTHINLGQGISLGKIGGLTVGIIETINTMSLCFMHKATNFIDYCDRFCIPLITAHVNGEMKTNNYTDAAILGAFSDLLGAYQLAEIPKIGVVTQSITGRIPLTLYNGGSGADLIYAFDTVSASLFRNEENMFGRKLIADVTSLCDVVIKPSEARVKVMSALEFLQSKRR
jgi:acetyl-CoA carboxylase carboxyltransferase component